VSIDQQETTAPTGPLAALSKEADAYRGDEERPLGGFVAVMAVYGAIVAVASLLARRRLPERFAWGDLALISVATHKVSRRLAKDPVTSPLRAPFTQFRGTSGTAELAEDVRGTGIRKAVGELLTCPFCLGQWVATAFVFGLVIAPRPTRLVASVFTAVAAADVLQFGYVKVERSATS
jgi:hypothetical protein